MDTQTQLQQNRRIIQDFVISVLAGIPSDFARLTYLASLRDMSTGRYKHDGLGALYEDEALQQALGQCHQEIFERILETPLERQLAEVRTHLGQMQEGVCAATIHWTRTEAYRTLMPETSPEYLQQLFCSNLRAMLEIVREECSTTR